MQLFTEKNKDSKVEYRGKGKVQDHEPLFSAPYFPCIANVFIYYWRHKAHVLVQCVKVPSVFVYNEEWLLCSLIAAC